MSVTMTFFLPEAAQWWQAGARYGCMDGFAAVLRGIGARLSGFDSLSLHHFVCISEFPVKKRLKTTQFFSYILNVWEKTFAWLCVP